MDEATVDFSSAEELRWRARGEDIVAVNSGGSYREPK